MDDTQTQLPQMLLDAAKGDGYRIGIREAANICGGIATAEREKADDACEETGTGDYLGFHALKGAEKQILAVIKEEPINE